MAECGAKSAARSQTQPRISLRSSGLQPDPASPYGLRRARARHRPVFTPAPGLAGLPLSSVFPKGRAERLGETPRPRRPQVSAGIPHAKHTGKVRREPDRPQNTGVACVPHAMDFAACCMRPGSFTFADPARSRASCRAGMHLDRPPVWPALTACQHPDPRLFRSVIRKPSGPTS